MNHQTGRSLLRDWTLHQIIEGWMTHYEDKNIGPDDHYRLPYLYRPSSNNKKSPPWFNSIFELQVSKFISNNLY